MRGETITKTRYTQFLPWNELFAESIPMFTRIVIVVVMLIIIGSLGSGLIFLVRDQGKSKRTIKALTIRIAISISLFIFLFVAFKLNWITPHGVFTK